MASSSTRTAPQLSDHTPPGAGDDRQVQPQLVEGDREDRVVPFAAAVAPVRADDDHDPAERLLEVFDARRTVHDLVIDGPGKKRSGWNVFVTVNPLPDVRCGEGTEHGTALIPLEMEPVVPSELIKYRVCDRCPHDVIATETHKLTLNGFRYELDLCDEHAAALNASVMAWADLGSPVGEPTIFDKPRVLATAQALQHFGDKACPRPRSEPEPAPHTGPLIADYADNWLFTDHARGRLAERHIDEWDALRAAQFPERVVRSRTRPDCYVHWRGTLKVVLNPDTHEILTVANDDTQQKVAN